MIISAAFILTGFVPFNVKMTQTELICGFVLVFLTFNIVNCLLTITRLQRKPDSTASEASPALGVYYRRQFLSLYTVLVFLSILLDFAVIVILKELLLKRLDAVWEARVINASTTLGILNNVSVACLFKTLLTLQQILFLHSTSPAHFVQAKVCLAVSTVGLLLSIFGLSGIRTFGVLGVLVSAVGDLIYIPWTRKYWIRNKSTKTVDTIRTRNNGTKTVDAIQVGCSLCSCAISISVLAVQRFEFVSYFVLVPLLDPKANE